MSLPFEETRGAFIVRRMRELGFRPSGELEADCVVFYKDYAGDDGRRSRVRAYFDKPILGMPQVRFAGVVVTEQLSVAPTPDAVAAAPSYAQDDLQEMLTTFSTAIPDQHLDARPCAECGVVAASFVLVDGAAACATCYEEHY